MAPQLLFGTGTMGINEVEFKDAKSVSSLLHILKSSGVTRIDSAARYPGPFPGRAEELLGQCKEQAADFAIDTKVFTNVQTDGSGDLTPEAIDKSTKESLARLQRTDSEGINILQTHRPDPSTPVRDQVHGFNEQIRKGRCRAWGMSNLSVKMVEEMLRVCEEDGLQKPVTYQGQYNIITRGPEAKLLPLLRKHGVAFTAYAPLAAGFMTGNFTKGEGSGTRFDSNHPFGKVMQQQYDTKPLRGPMEEFIHEVTAQGLKPVEVAMRWIYYHSAIGSQDGIIFGASKSQQITELLAMVETGPLPADTLKSAEKLWEQVQSCRK